MVFIAALPRTMGFSRASPLLSSEALPSFLTYLHWASPLCFFAFLLSFLEALTVTSNCIPSSLHLDLGCQQPGLPLPLTHCWCPSQLQSLSPRDGSWLPPLHHCPHGPSAFLLSHSLWALHGEFCILSFDLSSRNLIFLNRYMVNSLRQTLSLYPLLSVGRTVGI